jgi:hypothetical protein
MIALSAAKLVPQWMLNEKIWNSQWVDQFCVPEDLCMIVVSFHDERATRVALSRRGEFYEKRRAQIRSFLLYLTFPASISHILAHAVFRVYHFLKLVAPFHAVPAGSLEEK